MTIAIDEGTSGLFWYRMVTNDVIFVSLASGVFAVGGTPDFGIHVKIPENRSAVAPQVAAGSGFGNGTVTDLRIVVQGQWIGVYRANLSTWANGAVNSIGFQMEILLLPQRT